MAGFFIWIFKMSVGYVKSDFELLNSTVWQDIEIFDLRLYLVFFTENALNLA